MESVDVLTSGEEMDVRHTKPSVTTYVSAVQVRITPTASVVKTWQQKTSMVLVSA